VSYLRFQAVAAGSVWPDGAVAVLSRRGGELLGVISWYPRWREHVFEAKPDTVWSNGCLCEVENKVSAMNAERRARATEVPA
jgi:hypothetical protein